MSDLLDESTLSNKRLVDNLRARLARAEKHLDFLRKSKKRMLGKQYNKNQIKRRADYGIQQKKLNDRAKETLYDQVKLERLKDSKCFDGISAVPFMLRWGKENNLEKEELNLFIILCHFKWCALSDLEAFGYVQKTAGRYLNKLVEKELAESFPSKKNTYVTSVKGESLFRTAQIYLTSNMKKLYVELDKKYAGRSGGSPVKLKRKYLNQIDVYKELGV